MGKLKMGIVICTSLLLAAAMSLSAAEVRPQDRTEQAAGLLERELQEKLMGAMQKSGTAASIDVCARESPVIIDRIDMYAMTTPLTSGRQPWLQEPRCGDCHGTKHQENSNTLYRNSVLTDAMNLGILRRATGPS
jgi:hypothetical protein